MRPPDRSNGALRSFGPGDGRRAGADQRLSTMASSPRPWRPARTEPRSVRPCREPARRPLTAATNTSSPMPNARRAPIRRSAPQPSRRQQQRSEHQRVAIDHPVGRRSRRAAGRGTAAVTLQLDPPTTRDGPDSSRTQRPRRCVRACEVRGDDQSAAAASPRRRTARRCLVTSRGLPGNCTCERSPVMSTDAPVSDAHQSRPRNSGADLRKQGEPRPRTRPRSDEDPRSGPDLRK